MNTTLVATKMIEIASHKAKIITDVNSVLTAAGSRRAFSLKRAPAVVMAADRTYLVQIDLGAAAGFDNREYATAAEAAEAVVVALNATTVIGGARQEQLFSAELTALGLV